MQEIMERQIAEDTQVVFVDAERKAYFVRRDADQPDRYIGYVQPADGSKAPRRLYCAYMAREGYATFAEALQQLRLYLSNKHNQWMRYDTYVNGKRVSEDEYSAIVRGEIRPPSPQDPVKIVALQDIEYRIAHHMRGAYNEMLEVGRCLNEAKESGLVAHGEWEEWVRRNTGFTERRAQKLMRAAREVPLGSAMERLPISKIQALLALPEEQREDMAQIAQAEELSLRELEKRIEDARREEQDKASAQLQALKSGYSSTIESLRALLRETQENAKAAEGGISAQAQAQIDQLKAQLLAAQTDMDAKLGQARRDADDAEEYAKRQAQQREQAQRELLEYKAREARGGAARLPAFGPDELAAAVRAFVGAAGVLPQMGAELAGIGNAERHIYRQYIDMIAQWVDGARAALAAECVPGCLEED